MGHSWAVFRLLCLLDRLATHTLLVREPLREHARLLADRVEPLLERFQLRSLRIPGSGSRTGKRSHAKAEKAFEYAIGEAVYAMRPTPRVGPRSPAMCCPAKARAA